MSNAVPTIIPTLLSTSISSLGVGDFGLPFTPTDISELELWMDGADQTTMTINGSNQITAWTDKSDNAIAFSRSASNAPVMVANAIGGKSAPDFSSSKSMIANNSALRQLAAITVVTVVVPKVDSITQGGTSVTPYGETLCVGDWGSKSIDFGGNFPSFSSTNGVRQVNGATLGPAVACNSNEFGWMADGHNKNVISIQDTSAAGTNIYRGTKKCNTSLLGGSATASSNISPANAGITSDELCIGGVNFNSSVFGRVNGYIAEKFAYGKVLSADERRKITSYVEKKWGIKAQVDVLHLISGVSQSNRITTDVLKSNAPSEFTSPSYGAYVNINGGFVHELDTNISLPSTTEYGPEQKMARDYYSRTGEPVIVSKHAAAGATVASWTPSGGSNYTTLAGYINGILADLDGFGFKVRDTLLDMQLGESAGLDATDADNFDDDIGPAIDGILALDGVGDSATVVMTQIYRDAPTIAHRATVRQRTLDFAAARRAAGKKVYVVDKAAWTTSDNLHWDNATVDDNLPVTVNDAYINQANQIA